MHRSSLWRKRFVRILPPTEDSISLAGSLLLYGSLVVVPTETVYGLAANALDEQAVEDIFKAKGRPLGHPLISHIGTLAQVELVVSKWPDQAQLLADAFWPGPLSIVLPKAKQLPSIVTGGLETAAVRMPGHEVFRRILQHTPAPLAAPSANLFTEVSPTRVEHLSPAILEAAALVIDAGPCQFGIESTVVDLSERTPRLLRPGAISASLLEAVLETTLAEGDRARSPGSHPKHYAPKARIHLVKEIVTKPGLIIGPINGPNQISMPAKAEQYAAQLYDALHELDKLGASEIWIEKPPETPEWYAVWDRLRRASSDG